MEADKSRDFVKTCVQIKYGTVIDTKLKVA